MKVNLLKPYGFCPGVEKAIEIASTILKEAKLAGKQVYFEHLLVHNEEVNNKLKEIYDYKIYDNSILSDNDVFLISAHGHNYNLDKNLNKTNIRSAFCFLLFKRFQEIEKAIKENKELLYLGEQNHPETISTLSFSEIKNKYSVKYFSTKEDIISYLDSKEEKQRLLIVQSTFAEDIIISFPKLDIIGACPYCYLRKNTLLKEAEYKTYIIVGSSTSSNTKALYKIAKDNFKSANVYLVNNANEIKDKNIIEPVLVCSGTSVSKLTVEEVYNYIKSL